MRGCGEYNLSRSREGPPLFPPPSPLASSLPLYTQPHGPGQAQHPAPRAGHPLQHRRGRRYTATTQKNCQPLQYNDWQLIGSYIPGDRLLHLRFLSSKAGYLLISRYISLIRCFSLVSSRFLPDCPASFIYSPPLTLLHVAPFPPMPINESIPPLSPKNIFFSFGGIIGGR